MALLQQALGEAQAAHRADRQKAEDRLRQASERQEAQAAESQLAVAGLEAQLRQLQVGAPLSLADRYKIYSSLSSFHTALTG